MASPVHSAIIEETWIERFRFFFRLYKYEIMQNRHCGVAVQLVRPFIGKLSGQSRRGARWYSEWQVPSTSHYWRNLNLTIQVFFRLYKYEIMLNRHCGVAVQLIRLFIGKLSGQSRRGTRWYSEWQVPPTPPLLKKPESNDSGFFSSIENGDNSAGYYPSSRKVGTSYPWSTHHVFEH